jgi:hypothetical protein
MSWLRNVSIACGIYLALDIGVAQAIKHTSLWGPEATERRYRRSTPPYHHGLATNVDVTGSWGGVRYPVRTNSLGFRDSDVRTIPQRAKSPRVVLIGDSFTEGSGVPYRDTYAGLLDSAFSRRGLEVLNAAVMSYSPSIYYRKLKYLLEELRLRIEYLVVAIDLSDIGDEAKLYQLDTLGNVVDRPTGSASRMRGLLKENSLLFHVADLTWDVARARSADPAHYTDWTDDPKARDSTSLQVRFWREWTRTRCVPFFNLFPAFLSQRAPISVLSDNFIPHDVHWNAKGHRLVAHTLMEAGLPDTIQGYLSR